MKVRSRGKRYPLLMYRRTLDRLWPSLILSGLILLALWAWAFFGKTALIPTADAPWLLFSGGILVILGILFILLRYAAYVQPHSDHLRVVTPFLQMRISYRRIHSVHPADVNSLYPPNQIPWSMRSYMEPFYGQTAVVVELSGYPMPLAVLRLFLARTMFYQQSKGLVFIVPDWMEFSTDLDTLRTSWLDKQRRRQ